MYLPVSGTFAIDSETVRAPHNLPQDGTRVGLLKDRRSRGAFSPSLSVYICLRLTFLCFSGNEIFSARRLPHARAENNQHDVGTPKAQHKGNVLRIPVFIDVPCLPFDNFSIISQPLKYIPSQYILIFNHETAAGKKTVPAYSSPLSICFRQTQLL